MRGRPISAAVARRNALDFAALLLATSLTDGALKDNPRIEKAVRHLMGQLYRRAGIRACRWCGCVEERACVGLLGAPCGWASKTLCTSCVGRG